MALPRRAGPLQAQKERRGERSRDQGEVDDHLDQPPPVYEQRAQERRRAVGCRLVVHVGEVAPELEQERERDQHADERDARVVEDVVGEAREPERGRHAREEHDRALVGEALVDEPVRGVVARAARHRPPLEHAHDRDERRVEDRHREHEQRQQQRRDGRAGDGPARGEAERGEREAEHLAAAVAHEHGGRPAQAKVVRQEAEAGEADAEGEGRDEMVRVLRERIEREEGARDRGQGRREPVHVVEQVEGVRHADEPHDAEHRRRDVVADDLDADAGDEHEGGGGELGPELRERREVVDVVEQPGHEEDGAAAEDAAERVVHRDQPGRGGDAAGGEQAGEDAAAAEQGRRALVPAVGARSGHDVAGRGCSQEQPDRQQAGGQSDECGRGDRHRATRLHRAVRAARGTRRSLVKGCYGRVWARGGDLPVR